MKEKAARRKQTGQKTEDGLPRDATDWTEDDWRDLYEAIETVMRKVGKRHERRT